MIHNIQSLRAFAAISVVLFHVIDRSSNGSDFFPEYLSLLKGWGEFGVDIFFIISGFIMMHIQLKNPKHSISFIKSRIIRIVPLYWLLSLVAMLAFLVSPESFRTINPDLGLLLNSLFFSNQIINGNVPILYVGWTLEWEMLFYLFFSIAIFFKNWKLGFILVFSLLTYIAFSFHQLLVFEFFLGMLLGFYFEKTHSLQKNETSIKIGNILFFIGILLYVSWFLNSDFFESWNRLFKWGIPALFLVAGALFAKQIHNKTIELLGDASYSIYLVQVFSIPVFYKLCKTLAPSLNGDLIAVLALIFSILAGVFTYLMIEKPMTNFLRTKLN